MILCYLILLSAVSYQCGCIFITDVHVEMTFYNILATGTQYNYTHFLELRFQECTRFDNGW